MDAGLIISKYTTGRREKYYGDSAIPEVVRLMNTVAWIVALVVGVPAAYLSWSANTVIGWGNFPKTVFSMFAFAFGGTYIIDHVIYKWDMLNYINSIN